MRMDHVVLWCADPLRSIDFYERVVGLPGVRVEEFRAGQAPFPSVRVSAESIIDLMPLAAAPRLGDSAGHPVHHLCLSMSHEEFEALRQRVDVAASMTDSFGAQGLAPHTFYFQDPDANVIEARYYGS